MGVVARRIRAIPYRTATEAWSVITNLVTKEDTNSRAEFDAISGIAGVLIADETPAGYPIVVNGSGPQLRAYCLYGDDALGGDDANEDSLVSSPASGDWMMWLPTTTEDLEWVTTELTKHTTRIKAYDVKDGRPDPKIEPAKAAQEVPLILNREVFLRS